jgi:hypothetical protein
MNMNMRNACHLWAGSAGVVPGRFKAMAVETILRDVETLI